MVPIPTQLAGIAAHLAAHPAPQPRPFVLSGTDRARLTGMNDFCRRDALGQMIYAHHCNEMIRCAVEGHNRLPTSAEERALIRRWAREGTALVDAVNAAEFGERRAA